MDLKELFNNTYQNSLWGYPNRSGGGSNTENAFSFACNLSRIAGKYNCSKIFDASCGDMFWIQHCIHMFDLYHGNDISDLIAIENQKKFSSLNNVKITHGSSVEILSAIEDKTYDLSFVRQTLEHIPTEIAIDLIREMKRTSRYYIVTSRNEAIKQNVGISPDGFIGRCININIEPYRSVVGEPIEVFYDVPFKDQNNNSYYGYLYKS